MISAWLHAHWLPAALLGGFGAMLIHHAVIGRRETKNLTDFFVGGRSMGGLVLGMSFFATFASTNAFVGLAGQSYTFGAPWLLFIPAFIACSLIAWIVVAPRFRAMTEELDSVTLADFVGSRYSSRASRIIVGAIIAVASVFYMTAISGSLYSVCLGPAVIGALLWKRGNGTAVIASIAAGVSTMLLWRAYPPASLHEVFPATAVSALVYCSWSVATEAARPKLAFEAQR